MDKCTFGNSKGAINLISVLEKPENVPYAHKVSAILSKYSQSMAAIMFIPDKTTRVAVLLEWRHKFLERINKANFPEVVRSHTSNLIVVLYRKCVYESKEGEE